MKITLIFLLVFAAGVSAYSQPYSPEAPKGPSLSAGAGLVWAKSVYKGADDTFVPLPVIVYREGLFSFNGLGASYAAYNSPEFDLNAGLGVRFGGFDPDESDYLEGMRERKTQINLGTILVCKADKNFVSLRLSFDLNNSGNGYETELALGRGFGDRKFIFRPSVKVIYESHDRANLNYGVYRSEVRADRPYYRLTDAVNLALEANLILSKGEKASSFLRVEWKALNKKIIQSPIINSSCEISAIAAHTWKF